jgi:hypothetical protein
LSNENAGAGGIIIEEDGHFFSFFLKNTFFSKRTRAIFFLFKKTHAEAFILSVCKDANEIILKIIMESILIHGPEQTLKSVISFRLGHNDDSKFFQLDMDFISPSIENKRKK